MKHNIFTRRNDAMSKDINVIATNCADTFQKRWEKKGKHWSTSYVVKVVNDSEVRILSYLDIRELDVKEDIKECFIVHKCWDADRTDYSFELHYVNRNGEVNDKGYGRIDDEYSIVLVDNKKGEYNYVLKEGDEVRYQSQPFSDYYVAEKNLIFIWKLYLNSRELYNEYELELVFKLAERDSSIAYHQIRMSREGFLNRMTEEEKVMYKEVVEKM